jgi:hypothetical protein
MQRVREKSRDWLGIPHYDEGKRKEPSSYARLFHICDVNKFIVPMSLLTIMKFSLQIMLIVPCLHCILILLLIFLMKIINMPSRW